MIDRRALAPTPSHNWGELVEGRPDVGDTTVASWAQWQQMLRQKGGLDGENRQHAVSSTLPGPVDTQTIS
eukprot:COSAG02_NODE_7456_length_3006_cov_1.921913_4_plen_70_part_00